MNPVSDFRFSIILVLLTACLQILLLAFLVNVVFSNKNMIQIYPIPKKGPKHAPEETHLVEKDTQLGGRLNGLYKLFPKDQEASILLDALKKKVEEQAEKIRGSFINAVTALAYALEAKDKYTSGHSQRVAEMV